MKINECSYCGMTAFTDEGICPACLAALGQAETVQNPNAENIVETSPVGAVFESFPQSFESENYAHQSQTVFVQETRSPPRRDSSENWKRCAVCNAGIAQYREVCSRCEVSVKSVKKKSGFGRYAAGIVMLILIVGGFYHFRADNSPAGILRKFEKATGTSNSLSFETFVMKGEAKITITGATSPGPTTISNPVRILAEEKYYFDMFFKNPNKSLLDFYKISVEPNSSAHESALKQGFNGINGWKYTNLFNQPVRVENNSDSFGDKRMGMGLDEYESVEELNDTIRAKYGDELIKAFESLKTFEVDGAAVQSDKKVFLLVKSPKTDGKTDESLLVFDEKSGFLVGMLKKNIINESSIFTKIFANGYKKFYVKEKGFFGIKGKFILVPTIWKFDMKLSKPAEKQGPLEVLLTIELKVESLLTDVPIDDAIFEKPAGN